MDANLYINPIATIGIFYWQGLVKPALKFGIDKFGIGKLRLSYNKDGSYNETVFLEDIYKPRHLVMLNWSSNCYPWH